MDPLTIALTSILGGISGAVTEHSEAKQLAKQVREQRKQLEEAANNLRALSLKEGAAAQSAYNWASAMVNKYKDNPQVLSSVSEGLNSQLTGIRNNANQFQTQAIQLLASKPATVSTKNAGLKGFLKGSMGGMGLGYSLTSNPTGENKFNLTDFVLGKFKNNTTTTTVNPSGIGTVELLKPTNLPETVSIEPTRMLHPSATAELLPDIVSFTKNISKYTNATNVPIYMNLYNELTKSNLDPTNPEWVRYINSKFKLGKGTYINFMKGLGYSEADALRYYN